MGHCQRRPPGLTQLALCPPAGTLAKAGPEPSALSCPQPAWAVQHVQGKMPAGPHPSGPGVTCPCLSSQPLSLGAGSVTARGPPPASRASVRPSKRRGRPPPRESSCRKRRGGPAFESLEGLLCKGHGCQLRMMGSLGDRVCLTLPRPEARGGAWEWLWY